MNPAALSTLPGESRVWCFGASRSLDRQAADRVRAELNAFLAAWTAHRAELRAAGDVLYDRFLVVAVDESSTGASGCSIDALMAEVGRLGSMANVDFLDGSPIWYRTDDGEIRRVGRLEFRRMAGEGEIDGRTRVFDLTVDQLDVVRSGDWEVEAGESWHARLL